MQFSKIRRILPAIRVHVWGGLGSQLFGVITANRLQVKWPNRRIALVFHSSGVTQRFFELDKGFIPNFTIIQKFDFVKVKSSEHITLDPNNTWNLSFKRFLKSLLLYFGIITNLDSNSQYKQLRPWLLSVRGHYSGIELLPGEIEKFIQFLDLNHLPGPDEGKDICVHLRLGDLLHLENKSHISMVRIASLPEVSSSRSDIFVFSDSEPIVARNLWQSEMPSSSCEFLAQDINRTILECVKSRVFVGTNSKISLWIAVFRLTLRVGKKTYLPLELQHYKNTILLHMNKDLGLTFY